MNSMEQLRSLSEASEAQIGRLKSQLRWYSTGRLIVFLCLVSAIYFFWSNSSLVWIASAVLIAVFLILLRRHADVKAALNHEKKYLAFIERELGARRGEWTAFDPGQEFRDPDHPFSSDLGVFGNYSLFQYINRSESALGRSRMASWLTTEFISKDEIDREKEIINELSDYPEFLFRLLALGSETAASEEGFERVKSWSQESGSKRSDFSWIVLRFLLPVLAISALVLMINGIISFNNLLLVLLIPGLVVGVNLKNHGKIFAETAEILSRADAFRDMLNLIEKQNFQRQSSLDLISSYHLASANEGLHKLTSIIGAIDSRNNVLVSILLNLFLSWDFQCAFRLKEWKLQYGEQLYDWMELANVFETYASFGLYAFMHPDYVNAEISESAGVELREAAHVLMDDSAVANDFYLDESGKITIITGANMAGKSTYLRMIGSNMLLAMRGLPVRAERMVFKPRRLFTSMLTVDSLGDSESYFFSELKRLRQLADLLEAGSEHFVILDEILKGTNSKDKAEGSKSFVKKLLSLPMKGIIATHDLSLCDLEQLYPDEIQNRKFEIEYDHNELVFKYRVEPGICQNMNASFLLQKMGLSE